MMSLKMGQDSDVLDVQMGMLISMSGHPYEAIICSKNGALSNGFYSLSTSLQ
jgi:hypothetical protein